MTSTQASSRKYDSLVEKVAARVAQQEIRKNEIRLISREYLFGTYDKTNYAWSGGLPLDVQGSVVPMSRIPMVSFPPNPNTGGISDIPETEDNEANVPYGLVYNIPEMTRHGFRISDFVRVNGFSLELRGVVNKRVEATVPLLDSSYVAWRLCLVTSDDVHGPAWEPSSREIQPQPHFMGFAPKLDHAESQTTDGVRTRVLCEGRMNFTYSVIKSDVKTKSWYTEFKNPVLIQYKPGDLGGQHHEGGALFLSLRSDVPSTQAYNQYRPMLFAVSKLYYKDT